MSASPRPLRELSIELMRPGALSGQLLSRLTPYLSIINDVHAETIHLPMDHLELLQLLRRIRYPQQRAQREESLRALCQRVGELLLRINMLPGILGEQEAQDQLTHIRLTLSGNELSLIPVEASYGPSPPFGEAEPLLTHTKRRVVMTRELRHSSRMPLDWTKPPRVLLVGAAPAPFEAIPLRAHTLALYQALLPFKQQVSHGDKAGRPMEQLLTVLDHATLHDIAEECASADPPYTHVVLLMHGVRIKSAGFDTYGVALHRPDGQLHAVSAEKLVGALRPRLRRGGGLATPTMVTLLSCHGSAQGDVVLPMGSVAHELHAAEIPWVLASQFPLSMAGSVALVDDFFPGLFLGDDPRDLLYDVRRSLALRSRSYDWASLVVYASIPSDFDAQLVATRRQMAHEAASLLFNQIDAETYTEQTSPAFAKRLSAQQEATYLNRLVTYRKRVEDTLPRETDARSAEARASVLGLLGSSYRNQAFLLARNELVVEEKAQQKFYEQLRRARDLYRESNLLWPMHSWHAVHELSLTLLLGEELMLMGWASAYRTATQQTQDKDLLIRCWGHIALMELYLLVLASPVDDCTAVTLTTLMGRKGTLDIIAGCRTAALAQLTSLIQLSPADSDVRRKLKRQLARYLFAVEQKYWSPTDAFKNTVSQILQLSDG